MSAPKRRIAVMGGSFNPVHTGHMIVASYIAQWGDVDEVWLMLSPQSPFKTDAADMVADSDRLAMLRIATSAMPRLGVCDIELTMPRPNYTVNTLAELERRYPDCSFTLIVGGDNWESFPRWRSPREIIDRHGLIVYPRRGYSLDGIDAEERVRLVHAPEVEISSTFIRQAIAQGRDMNFFLPTGVYEYICTHNLYSSSPKI